MTQPQVQIYKGTSFSAMTTEFNGLASGSGAASSVIHGTGIVSVANDCGNMPNLDIRLFVNGTGSNQTANQSVNGWFTRKVDGTNIESGTPPNRPPDFSMVTIASKTTYYDAIGVPCPAEDFGLYLVPTTGQALPASGNILTIQPWTTVIPTV